MSYPLPVAILAVVLDIVAAALCLSTLVRCISRSVVVGFVNALAFLIFLAQLPELIGMPWVVYAVCAAGLAIIYLLPLATKIVPSPRVAIVVLTIACVWLGLDIRTVGDMGELPDSMPVFLFPDLPWTLETLRIVLPVPAPLARAEEHTAEL